MGRKSFVILFMVLSLLGAQAQNSQSQSQAKRARVKPKTQEQMLLEQLNEKFQTLDQTDDARFRI
jgi:hypothetical protein